MRSLPMVQAAPHKNQLRTSVAYAQAYVYHHRMFFVRLLSTLRSHTCAPNMHAYRAGQVWISSMHGACPFLREHTRPTTLRIPYQCALFGLPIVTVIPDQTGIPFTIDDFYKLMAELQEERKVNTGTITFLQLGRLWQCRQLQEDLTLHGRYLGERRCKEHDPPRPPGPPSVKELSEIPRLPDEYAKVVSNAKKVAYVASALNKIPSPSIAKESPPSDISGAEQLEATDEMRTARSRYEELLKELPKGAELWGLLTTPVLFPGCLLLLGIMFVWCFSKTR